jgi:hypothetical protein
MKHQPYTPAQHRKIFALAKEQGIDKDTLDIVVWNYAKKESMKDLTINEAVQIINALTPSTQNGHGTITSKQLSYIKGLGKEVGLDTETKLNKWVENKYGVSAVSWLTKEIAIQAIEGLKIMLDRKKEQEKLCV